jgi:hypothetical protein
MVTAGGEYCHLRGWEALIGLNWIGGRCDGLGGQVDTPRGEGAVPRGIGNALVYLCYVLRCL